ncbi:MAG: YhfC family intramembrane metalloprotease [Oscillospiraceae bacterium]|nr:YhfC family intramembrane metalloprotease [Oscillospiraceae bacterium]
MISDSVMIMMAVQAAAGLLLPAALLLVLHKRYGCAYKPFFVGCAVFLVFALVLESLVHRLVLGGGAGETIRSSRWLYACYGALMAGLFEELGRYAAFRTVLRRELSDGRTALMYGAGHGGFECFVLLVSAQVGNLLLASAYRSSGMDAVLALAGGREEYARQLIDAILALSPAAYLLGIAERCIAITLHIALSVIVWLAARDDVRRRGFLALAVFLHFAADFVTVVLGGSIPPLWMEFDLAVVVLCVALLARALWRRYAQTGGEAALET